MKRSLKRSTLLAILASFLTLSAAALIFFVVAPASAATSPWISSVGCPDSASQGQSFPCNPSSSGTVTSRTWTAPGGSPASGSSTNFSTTFNSTGAKTITLRLCNGNLCMSRSQTVTIKAPTSKTSNLPIPFIRQYVRGNLVQFDCGPTSVAMILSYRVAPYNKRPTGKSDAQFVLDVRNATGVYGDARTGFDALEKALKSYGLSTSRTSYSTPNAQFDAMRRATESGKPVIVLLHGDTLGRGSNYGDHWVVLRGFSADGNTVYVNDPDLRTTADSDGKRPGWKVGAGENKAWPSALFQDAAQKANGGGAYGIVVG